MSNEADIKTISEIFYESIRNLDKKQSLDPNKLKQFKEKSLKPLYPHKLDGQVLRKYYCTQALCTSPGAFCCCTSSQPQSQFIKFGLSISLYLKFLKHSICFYFFMSLLAILSCAVCYMVAYSNNIQPLESYQNFLYSTTYGSFASQHSKCQYSLINSTQKASFDIKCNVGKVHLFNPIISNQSLNSINNCRNQRRKQERGDSSANSALFQINSTKCNTDNTECKIQVTYIKTPTSQSYQTMAYTYQCVNIYYKVGMLNFESRFYLYFIVGLDVFISLWFFAFILSQIKAQQAQTQFYKRNQVSLNDYAIKIKGFTNKTAQKQLDNLLNQLKKRYQQDYHQTVASFSFSQNQQMLRHSNEKVQVFEQIQKLIHKYYFEQPSNKQLNYDQCHNKVFESKQGLYNEYKKQFTILINKIVSFEKKRVHIDDTDQQITLYLIFNSIKYRNMIKQLLHSTCCKDNQLTINNKIYQVYQAPIPDMIIWENKFKWTKIRVFISWIITIIICAGSYLLFGYIQYKQTQLLNQYNYSIDCNVLYTSIQLNTLNQTLLSTDSNYLTCVCKNQGLLSAATSNQNYCSNWQTQYILYLTIPLLISIGIVVYNIIVTYIFKIMSRCERHKLVINQQLSFTLKRSFLLIMNMGLIMILLNINYKNSLDLNQISFIFLGKYDDFTPDWYQNIGTIIVLTMVFNIATPITQFILSFIIKCFTKCWDTRCFRIPTSQKKKRQYLQLYSDDVFPVGQRYAYLIATFFITFSFSGVIPILLPIAVISFTLLYFSDKLLLFKFFQTPINYTQKLHKLLMKVVTLSMFSHFALTTYFLTEPNLLASNSRVTNQTIIPNNSRVDSMIANFYLYPYLGFLALMIIYYFIKNFCGSLKATFLNLCFKKKNVYEENQGALKQATRFWPILSDFQRQKLYQLTQYYIQRHDRRIHGAAALSVMVSKNFSALALKKSQHAQTISLSVLVNSMEIMEEIEEIMKRNGPKPFDDESLNLIGQPSYSYLINSQNLERNTEMLKIQTELTNKYKQNQSYVSPKKNLTVPGQGQKETNNAVNDASAAQLHKEM